MSNDDEYVKQYKHTHVNKTRSTDELTSRRTVENIKESVVKLKNKTTRNRACSEYLANSRDDD